MGFAAFTHRGEMEFFYFIFNFLIFFGRVTGVLKDQFGAMNG
jgi:hypothetical protein